MSRFDLSSFWAGLFFGLCLTVAMLVYITNTGVSLVNCPEEDSCYADYFDGTWHIVPGER